jgi:hypothetical protein
MGELKFLTCFQFLQDILDALFGMMSTDYDNQPLLIPLVFKALVSYYLYAECLGR